MNKAECLRDAKRLFAQILITCGMLCFYACSDKAKEDFSDIPGVKNETWPNIVKCDSGNESFVYTFEALNKWSVVSSDDWCNVSPVSGYKGESYFKVEVDKNETEIERTATITINVENYMAVSFTLEQEKEKVEVKPEPELKMNLIMDNFLESYYLWNDDYKKLSRDLSIPYVDSYDNFLKTTLMGMTTNILDKKKQIIDYDASGNPIYGYTLYSYVDRVLKGLGTRSDVDPGVNHGIEKQGEIESYGFSRMDVVRIVDELGKPTDQYVIAVKAVYPNSMASTLGVGRGTIITHINGQEISKSNYASSYLDLLNPTQSQVKLSIMTSDSISDVVLTATKLDPTPILVNTIVEEGADKIGYLVYDAFDAAYDNDLLNVLADFKAKGVTDLVLDLRYNGGGYVMTSNMLSSCLIGDGCKDKIFHYYRYNASRMSDIQKTQKETGHTYDEGSGLFGEKYMYDDYYGVDLAPYSLNLKRLFVLTTKSTASASEAVINSLRGHDVSVIIIGEDTNGKNVGMESIEFNLEGYTYELAPITFQSYNMKKETVPSDGFLVDYAVSDWNNGYIDFADLNEPMFKKALDIITASSRTVIQPFASSKIMNGQIMHLPTASRHPEGMIVIRKNGGI